MYAWIWHRLPGRIPARRGCGPWSSWPWWRPCGSASSRGPRFTCRSTPPASAT